MRFISMFFCLLLKTVPAIAQAAPADPQIVQPMLNEIREPRHDLQNPAASIQRVQIVMYRHQAQAGALERATQRFEQARGACAQAQAEQTLLAAQLEKAEATKRNSQNASDQTVADQLISHLQSNVEMWNTQAQQCQGEQSDAENQFRAEQAKMSDLENQLSQLDQVLAGKQTDASK